MIWAFWCVLIAMCLPWAAAVYAKKKGGYTAADNYQPRDFLNRLQGAAARADAAQKNSFEIFPAFAAAVIIAVLQEGDPTVINLLATLFIVSRIVYIYCYIRNRASLRSAVWAVGLLCIVGLFIAAAL